MDIVTLAERFVSGLLEIQQDFTKDARLDMLEQQTAIKRLAVIKTMVQIRPRAK